jgi:hypothetical protein
MKVKFQTREGETVSFTANPKRKPRKAANSYARYVKKHIGKYLEQGQDPTEAMRSVARQYRRG